LRRAGGAGALQRGGEQIEHVGPRIHGRRVDGRARARPRSGCVLYVRLNGFLALIRPYHRHCKLSDVRQSAYKGIDVLYAPISHSLWNIYA
jgi:hypothetical protein